MAQDIIPSPLNGGVIRLRVGVVLRHAAIALLVLLSRAAMAESGRAEPLAAPSAAVPVAEAGRPFIRNFDPAEYGAGAQNWAIAQDRQGVTYFANNENVLAFDGTTWRRIAIANLSTVHALAVDGAGRIYVGAVGELGYLAPDGAGQMQYVSLLERIAPEERGFTDVWRVFAIDDAVYFSTYTSLFRLRGDRVTVWKPATAFHWAFRARDTLYVQEVGRGLMQLVGDRLVPVPGGERFATERIRALLPWGEPAAATSGDLLIGTQTQGWFIFDGTGYRPWMTEADDALKRDGIYGAIWLANGMLAVATVQSGVSLLDDHGRLLQHLTKASGLVGDVVYALFQDRQRGLWLGLDNGLARIDIGSPLTQYDDRTGLAGTVLASQRHAGRLYAGTSQGVFRLDSDTEGLARFVPVPQIPRGQTWSFLELGHSLLVAHITGVFEIGDDQIRRVRASERATLSLLRSKHDPARVFVGLSDGVASMRLENGHWIDEGRIPGITDNGRTLFEESDGRLWLGIQNGAVIRLTFPHGWPGNGDAGPSVRMEHFGVDQGLSAGGNLVYPIDGMPRFASKSRGLLQFDERAGRFIPDPRFATLFPTEPRKLFPVQEAAPGRVWMSTHEYSSSLKETGAAVRDGSGIFRWAPTPLQPLSGRDIQSIYGDPDGVMWFGGAKGLLRYDPGLNVTHDELFTAVVRKVVGRDGRVLFGGTGQQAAPQIAHENKALRIEFAGPSFDTLEANRFQVLLEGLDRDWSAWSSEAYRDYTNLPEGDYRFRVRTRNVYGVVSAEASYAFSILPPWYRTGWAYFGFATIFIALLWLVFHWRSTALRRRNVELAGLVSVRTEELSDANDALGERNTELVALNQKLAGAQSQLLQSEKMAAVGQLAAGIAHEINNPIGFVRSNLTSLSRYVNDLVSVLDAYEKFVRAPGSKDTESRKLEQLQKSVDVNFLREDIPSLLTESSLGLGRVEKIVKDLKEFTHLDEAEWQCVDIHNGLESTLNVAAHEIRPKADVVREYGDLPAIECQPAQINQVFLNLLINAAQSHVERGTITVRTGRNEDSIWIQIADTGKGIDAAHIGRIFDPFFTTKPIGVGPGLGLSVSYSIVQQHGGTIDVTSEVGKGSTFTVHLPIKARRLA